MNDLEKMTEELKNILEKGKNKIGYIDDVIEYVNKCREIYLKSDNVYLYIEYRLLRYLKEYNDYLLIRKEMHEDSDFPVLRTEDMVISDIDNLFDEIGYYDKINRITSYYDEKIENNEVLSNIDFKHYELLLENQCFSNLPDSYIDYYFKLVFNYEYKPNIEAVKECIMNLGKNYLNELGISCKFKFIDIKEKGINGYYQDSKIFLDNKLAEIFITNKDSFSYKLFVTLFHEIRHAIQDNTINSSEYKDYTHLKMLKDELLMQYIDSSYHRDNYSKLSEEHDSYSNELIMTKRYFDEIGVTTINSSYIYLENLIIIIFQNTDNRVINSKLLPIDIVFDLYFKEIMDKYYVENNESIFQKYPVLRYIYHEDGNRKTTEELLKIKNDSNNLNEKMIINDILENQVISYKEIYDMLSSSNGDIEKNKEAIHMFIKRTKLNLRSFIDLYTYLVAKITHGKNMAIKTFKGINESLSKATKK